LESQLTSNLHDDLIARCKAGDERAFHQLYQLYARAMYNVSFRIVGNDEEAEDVLQEAFISAFQHLDNYRAEASFGAWLKRIVINKSINVLKQRRNIRWPEEGDFDVPEETTSAEYGDSLSVERVRKAILELPEGYRAVLSLYLLEGYDHQEIGQILGISESTSKSQLNRAKGKLREKLTVLL
jgi:RNA polymerase sigma factor (sigma-70 family)